VLATGAEPTSYFGKDKKKKEKKEGKRVEDAIGNPPQNSSSVSKRRGENRRIAPGNGRATSVPFLNGGGEKKKKKGREKAPGWPSPNLPVFRHGRRIPQKGGGKEKKKGEGVAIRRRFALPLLFRSRSRPLRGRRSGREGKGGKEEKEGEGPSSVRFSHFICRRIIRQTVVGGGRGGGGKRGENGWGSLSTTTNL